MRNGIGKGLGLFAMLSAAVGLSGTAQASESYYSPPAFVPPNDTYVTNTQSGKFVGKVWKGGTTSNSQKQRSNRRKGKRRAK